MILLKSRQTKVQKTPQSSLVYFTAYLIKYLMSVAFFAVGNEIRLGPVWDSLCFRWNHLSQSVPAIQRLADISHVIRPKHSDEVVSRNAEVIIKRFGNDQLIHPTSSSVAGNTTVPMRSLSKRGRAFRGHSHILDDVLFKPEKCVWQISLNET